MSNAYLTQPVRRTFDVSWQEEYLIGMLNASGPINGNRVLRESSEIMSLATAHKYLQLAIAKKLISKKRSKEDYREAFFSTTAKGEKFLQELRHVHR